MSYLDPKEDVIDLELTSYGKYLLSVGRLKPVYYAFFDDDIIYDNSYAGVTTEQQSEIEPRIQEETPRFSTQVVFSGRDLEIFNKNPNVVNDLVIGSNFSSPDSVYETAIEQNKIKIQSQPEATEILQLPIGNTNPSKDYAPSWNVAFLKAELSSSVGYLSISGSRGAKNLPIPQLDCDVTYEIQRNTRAYNIKNKPELASLADGDDEDLFDPPTEAYFPIGGGTVFVEKDFLMLRIEEANTFFEIDNFDIELFKVDTIFEKDSDVPKEVLLPLKFYKDQETLSEDLFSDSLDNQSAEYFFDILVDSEIPSDIACPLISDDVPEQIYQSKIFSCEDLLMERPDGFLEGMPKDLYADTDDTKDFCD